MTELTAEITELTTKWRTNSCYISLERVVEPILLIDLDRGKDYVRIRGLS